MGNGEYIVSNVAFTVQSPVKITSITFHNSNAAEQSLAFANAGMPSTDALFSVFAPATSEQQLFFNGIVFRDGFTCTPSHANINNIIVEYEDLQT